MRANDVDSDTSERKVLEHAAGWIDRLGRENEIRRSIAEVQIVVDACQRYALFSAWTSSSPLHTWDLGP
jgi:hypothetical protein